MASAHSPPRGDDDSSFSSSTDDEFSVGTSSNHTVDDGKSSTSSLSDVILETPVFNSSSRSSTNAVVLNKPCEEDIEIWNDASRLVWMEERPLRLLQSIAINMSVDSDICDKKLGFFARCAFYLIEVTLCNVGGSIKHDCQGIIHQIMPDKCLPGIRPVE